MVKAMKQPMKNHALTKIARGKAAWGKTVTIGGTKYDKAMIDAANYGAKGDGVISIADSKLILKAARPSGTNRDSYDDVEKATMAYIRTNFKFTDAADKVLRSSIAKLGAQQAKVTRAKNAREAMKRAASPIRGSPSPVKGGKRARVAFDAKMEQVVAKLSGEFEAASVSACAMLAIGAPFALGLTVEERHQFHETIVANIREVLSAVKVRLDNEVTEASQSAKETADACERTAHDQTAASSAHEAAKAAAHEQSEKVVTVTAEFDEAHAAQSETQDKVWACESEKDKVGKKKEKWTACKPWRALLELEADVPEKQVNKLNEQLAKILKSLGAEDTLLIAVARSLSKPAAERSEFDSSTIKWVTEMFDKEIAKLDAELKEDEAHEAECQAAMRAAAAVLESKQNVKTKEEEQLNHLESVDQEKAAALHEANQQVKASTKAHNKFERHITEAEEEVTEHAEVLEAFEYLAARSSAPPPPSPSPAPDEETADP